MSSYLNDKVYDFYVISDDAEWENMIIIELQKRRQAVKCISSNEWIPGKNKLDNLIEPVNNCKKVVIGFTSSPSTGIQNYLAQSIAQNMLDNNSFGKLIPVRISEDSIIPDIFNILAPANGWEDNLCEKLFSALDEMAARTLEEQISCPSHTNKVLEFYCSTCKKSACDDCKHVLRCYQNKHNVISMKTAVDEFNHSANEVINTAQGIHIKLKGRLDSINNDRSDFEHHLNLCRTAIKVQETTLIKKVQEKTKELISDVEKIYKEKKENVDSQIKEIDSKITEVKNVIASINKLLNKPQETETLKAHMETVNVVRDKVEGTDFNNGLRKIIPHFIPSANLDEVMNTESIGKITNVYDMYEVAKDEEITVTEGQPFVVTVLCLAESDACKLSATLLNSAGEESSTEIEYQINGEYKIMDSCNVEGDWQMKITAEEAHIKGSPVNIKVEKLGLVHTTKNISNYKQDNNTHVQDVEVDTDGCILVSSISRHILKFNKSGSFVAKIHILQDAKVNKMHQCRDYGHMMYSDFLRKCVVMCDIEFREICSFGEGILKYPQGLTLNKRTRVLYVADRDAHCVFKFNVDDGRLLGQIGSKGKEVGQMDEPDDVILTREGFVIVADRMNHRIQMFDEDDNLIKIIVGSGYEDGEVIGPCGITMDTDDNVIVASQNKIQIFDKNGVFIKRIDHKDDGLHIPCGITVISNRPRRVAVANHKPNNVKIFNY